MSKWFRTGGVAVALLMAIFLQMDTLTRVLGGVLAGILWLAVASCLPEEISDYSKAQKVIIGVILGSIVMITALLVKTIMSKGLMGGSMGVDFVMPTPSKNLYPMMTRSRGK
ncbi:MAG: hypothetical protein M0Z65_02885 [Firmicutes bacterium]|nr:hypothetical protein [Bacillota bacterium]